MKTWVVGEVKLGVDSFYNAWKRKRRGQWNAIWRHAKRKGYPPHAVLLLAFRTGKGGGKKRHFKFLRSEIKEQKVKGFVIVLQKRIIAVY